MSAFTTTVIKHDKQLDNSLEVRLYWPIQKDNKNKSATVYKSMISVCKIAKIRQK